MAIALMSAMEEECSSLIKQLENVKQTTIADRNYYEGTLWGQQVVIVFSRWGKVAAASTAVVLIREFDVSEIIFTGVAGAIDRELNVGDVVIGSQIYQHDLDVRPILAQYEIPLLGIVAIETDRARQTQLLSAAKDFVGQQLSDAIPEDSIEEFNLGNARVIIGGIATGDQFITCEETAARIKTNLPDVVCVEMEGGAVAQICNEYNVKFSLIRTISDSANSESSIDFSKFITFVAQAYSLGIINNLFNSVEDI